MKTNKNKITQVANLIEELSWLLETKKYISLKEAANIIRESNISTDLSKSKVAEKYAQKNPNKQFLIGTLPKLLQDSELFKRNSEMLDFAEEVLMLKPSRAGKRSRIEYIGWIICEVSNSNDKELENLVNSLSKIIEDEKKLKKIKNAKKMPNFSWNEAIQKLGE